MKRDIEIAVLSDLHLGTVGCHAVELAQYLQSIRPQKLILNGDIIDIWNFRKYYWPETHMLVIKTILNMMAAGTEVYYLTGNHDEVIRKISSLQIGQFHIKDKLILSLNGKKCWIFHGDVFDVTMKHSKWVAKLGGIGYDMLIMLNQAINKLLSLAGQEKFSLSKRIKNSVKQAVKFIDDFEQTAIDLAIDNNYDYVICGHIHQPVIKKATNSVGSVIYMNSGDWVENLTTLEFYNNRWELYRYSPEDFHGIPVTPLSGSDKLNISIEQLLTID